MKIQSLDHIALYMNDRAAAAEALTSYLGFHVVDHTDRYTLVGAGGRIGKLTLFDSPQGSKSGPGIIENITIRVADPQAAADRLPQDMDVEEQDGGFFFDGPEGLRFGLVAGTGDFVDYDLEGLTLRSRTPENSARQFVQMGFSPGDGAVSVKAGEYNMNLVEKEPRKAGQEMLFHLGCRVESAEEHRREAEDHGFEIQDVVDGPNTLAVFVMGPENVSVEYVEHKATFSLI